MTKELVDSLYLKGVRKVISAPGGRSAALLNQFLDDGRFSVETVYDERTAGFYALGLSMNEEPVVVLTTSGSAVTELHSAVVEAFHQKHSKLIVLTADRPERFRGTGAPQTIDQYNIFNKSVRSFFDLSSSVTTFNSENLKYPAHVNVCLESPTSLPEVENEKNKFGPLLIVSALNSSESNLVTETFKSYKGAMIIESLSNLSQKDFPNAAVIKNSEITLNHFGLSSFSSFYRLGGVPLFKQWRFLEGREVYFWNAYEFKGGVGVESKSLDQIKKDLKDVEEPEEPLVFYDESVTKKIEELFSKYKKAEVSLLQNLSKSIPEGSNVFLGNSLPIREWEFCKKSEFRYFGQRGVNGIDGSLSFFLGQTSEDKENWIILGDLTTLYNLNDFQLLEKVSKKKKIRIVVVNNSGGQIFKKIFKKNTEYFVNKQSVDFKKVAELWSVDHQEWPLAKKDLADIVMIEIKPDLLQSEKFWNELSEK